MLYREKHPDGENKIEYRIFDSMGEYVDFAASVPQKRVGEHDCMQCPSFTGRSFDTWEAVYAATREAWDEGIAILDRMLHDLEGADLPKPTSRKRKSQFREDDGDELDYDRLRTGQAFWRATRRTNTKGPATITVLVDVCANANVNHQNILWRGAAAIALTKILEEAGYRVELWSYHKTKDLWSNETIDSLMSVRLKAPSDVLDVSTLISAVSGWCFRTVGFRNQCCGKHSIASNLGHHAVPSSDDLDEITPDRNRHLIADAFSYSDAVAKVRQVLNTLSQGASK